MSDVEGHDIPICMIDNGGRPVVEWLPHMQSSETLRRLIARGLRTADCFAALKRRRERIHAAMRAIHGPDWTPTRKAPDA